MSGGTKKKKKGVCVCVCAKVHILTFGDCSDSQEGLLKKQLFLIFFLFFLFPVGGVTAVRLRLTRPFHITAFPQHLCAPGL